MNPGRRLATAVANTAWLVASVPGTLAFILALRFPHWAQRRVLRRTMRANRATDCGRLHGFAAIREFAEFARVPPSDYDALRPAIDAIRAGATGVLTAEPVILLQPTSGTSAAPKLIPFTRGLQRQFAAALAPWIASLYALRPRLLFGKHYWCLSPNTGAREDDHGAVPTGFAEDTEYLGRLGRSLARQILVAPPELARVSDPQAFEFLTQLFLVAEEDLRLISVWHPSFLTVLLDALPRHATALAASLRDGRIPAELDLPPEVRTRLQASLRPRPRRAGAVHAAVRGGTIAPGALWPRLQLISCWAGPSCDRWIGRLGAWFPGVAIQPKGLLATEGVVTIPWGLSGRQVCAVRSHVLEFADPDRPERPLLSCANLPPEGEYTAVLTTAGGLCRYRLGDRVRVTGRVGRTPCLEFVRREGLVCDICGEKITEGDAAAALAVVAHAAGGHAQFGMLVPDRGTSPPGYVLILEVNPGDDAAAWAPRVEETLQQNFHYRHARRLGQLAPVRLLGVTHAAERARAWLVARGLRHGDIKFPALRTEAGWLAVFASSDGCPPHGPEPRHRRKIT